MEIKRGDIYYIESIFNETGSEQKSGRPAIVVSNDKNNRYSDVIEVVYLTSKQKTELPTHVKIQSLRTESIALCEQVSSVSTKRVGGFKARITGDELAQIDIALLASLDLNVPSEPQGQLAPPSAAVIEYDRTVTERDFYKKMYEDIYRLFREVNMKAVVTE